MKCAECTEGVQVLFTSTRPCSVCDGMGVVVTPVPSVDMPAYTYATWYLIPQKNEIDE
jgi:hypothetical protein